ncbi:hypothetical protein SLS56_010361 [Neofusicoccum ribis]|uniref:Uncharacterized protein n=1 Tax=Neofusicoccum ribis TaxID=45134 RepID=A0ABR3SFB4_9PEZI
MLTQHPQPDFGESHYIGPLSSKHYDDGNSKWTNDMPHNGWADLAAPFIAAYKAGSTDVTPYITTEKLVYWFRPQPKGLDCAATDNAFSVSRGDQLVLGGSAPKQVSAECVCGLYNFNAFVGTLPAGTPDALDADGLSRFTEGLKVSTCSPTPTLTAKR